MEIPHICRYCGGIVRLVPAESVYGDSAVRLGLKGEKLYQCQNCNARVGCHRGTVRPLGDLANEVLRLKRIETHQVFDAYWTERGMSRTQAYRWLAKKMHLPERKAHIGGFEILQHRCKPARPPAGLCVQPLLILQRFPVDKSKAGKHNRPVSENNVAARQ